MRRTFTNPVVADDHGTDDGDPFVLQHLGEYFLYPATDDGDRPISVHRSTDLVHWTSAGFALEGGDPGHWGRDRPVGTRGHVLARLLLHVRGRHADGPGRGRRGGRPAPGGGCRGQPARAVGVRRGAAGSGRLVDRRASVQDEEGILWLFYNVRNDQTELDGRPGSGTVVDRFLAPDRLEVDPVEVAFRSERWEGSFTGDAYWNEGSWVLKRRGRYHQLYSGGFYRDASYGIGITSARRPRGPCVKDPDNPIFQSGERITGPGHHSVILAPRRRELLRRVSRLRGRAAGPQGAPRPGGLVRRSPVIGPGPVMGRPTEAPQAVPPGPVHDAAVPFWHADLFLVGDGRGAELGRSR